MPDPLKLLTFRTASSRVCTVALEADTTLDEIVAHIASTLSLTRESVKLFDGSQRIVELTQLLQSSSTVFLVVGKKSNDGSSVGSGKESSTPVSLPSQLHVEHPQPWLLPHPQGPLSFPHSPGGLNEIVAIIENSGSDSTISQLYDELQSHPTMNYIAEVIEGKRATEPHCIVENEREVRLSEVLRQIQSECRRFFVWITENTEVFLHLVNRAENPYASLDLGDLMLAGLHAVIDGVFEAWPAESQAAQRPLKAIPHGATSAVIHVEHNGADYIVQTQQFTIENGLEQDRQTQVEPDAEDPEGELRILEENVQTIDDPLYQASVLRDLAATYQNKFLNCDPLTPEALTLLEHKTSHYLHRAITAILRIVQKAGPDDVSTIHAVCSFGPPCFIAAQIWFRERDQLSSLAACIAHLGFWEEIERIRVQERHVDAARVENSFPDDAASAVYSHASSSNLRASAATSAASISRGGTDEASALSILDPFQSAMQLIRYTQHHHTTVVLYSLLGQDGMYVYLIHSGGDVRIVKTPIVLDGFKGSMTFIEEALRRRRFGVNLNVLWSEHLTAMYQALVLPIEHLLPNRPQEPEDAHAGQVCFVVSFSSVPLPFSAMLDENGVPCIAKWAIFQAHVPADLVAADAVEYSDEVTTNVLTDAPPSWLTRNLSKVLNVVSRKTNLSHPLILHVDDAEAYSMLPQCDLFVSERFCEGLRYQVRRAALVRGMKISQEGSDSDVLPYEYYRSFYLNLSEGLSIARSQRMASMACLSAYPMEPWLWGSVMLFNFGGILPPLEQRIERMHQSQVRKEQRIQRSMRALAVAPETRYSEHLGINTIYDAMLTNLLRERPLAEDAILDSLIATLETFPADFRSTRPSTTTLSTVSTSSVRIAPMPPERPPTKPQRPSHNATLYSSPSPDPTTDRTY